MRFCETESGLLFVTASFLALNVSWRIFWVLRILWSWITSFSLSSLSALTALTSEAALWNYLFLGLETGGIAISLGGLVSGGFVYLFGLGGVAILGLLEAVYCSIQGRKQDNFHFHGLYVFLNDRSFSFFAEKTSPSRVQRVFIGVTTLVVLICLLISIITAEFSLCVREPLGQALCWMWLISYHLSGLWSFRVAKAYWARRR